MAATPAVPLITYDAEKDAFSVGEEAAAFLDGIKEQVGEFVRRTASDGVPPARCHGAGAARAPADARRLLRDGR